jgi:hypothetical protein
MLLHDFFAWLEATPLATAIRESTWLFPTIETAHVLSIVMVVGSILVVDLRLLHVSSRQRPVSTLIAEVLPWTWTAFVCAAITGSLLFTSAAVKYSQNWPFRIKMGLLVLAAINMGIFHLRTYRTVHHWDSAPTRASLPAGVKFAGLLSLLIWITVVAMGRWIGFTTN